MAERFLDQRWPWWAAAALIFLALFSTVVEFSPVDPLESMPSGSAEEIERLRQRRDANILFVLIDTLRSDRLSAYGYQRETSPNLDRLARGGVRFARNLSQSSWTKTSMASLWTGLYPASVGITAFDDVIPEEAVMPAEILREAGYRTAGIYRNGWVAPTFGFGQGFEVYQKSTARKLPSHLRRENPTLSDRSTDEAAIRLALEFLRLHAIDDQGIHEKWFLYLHLMDLHEYIYDSETALFGSTYSDIYDNSIRWTDQTLGILIDSMAQMGALDNTIIVVASDHGEAFGERGFEGHARYVFRETTDVPLLIRFPFRLDPGLVIHSRTRNVDLWPTILDLIGLEGPDGDGRSRVPEILSAARGDTVPPRAGEFGVAMLNQNWAKPGTEERRTIAVVEDRLRFVRGESEYGPYEQLFDAADDPAELLDRASERPEDLERLRQAADAFLGTEPAWTIPSRQLSELELGQLRALGYAVE